VRQTSGRWYASQDLAKVEDLVSCFDCPAAAPPDNRGFFLAAMQEAYNLGFAISPLSMPAPPSLLCALVPAFSSRPATTADNGGSAALVLSR